MKFETYAQINLDNLKYNVGRLKNMIETVEIMAVLKADAYGHGAPKVFKTLIETGVSNFATANLFEALQLRNFNKSVDILVFGNIHYENIFLAVENNITITIYSYEQWREIQPYIKKKVSVQFKINTGFNRLGFFPNEESLAQIKEICDNEHVNVVGIYSHFALANEEMDRLQYKKFVNFVDELESNGLKFKFKHIADSVATVKYPWSRLNMVRLGAVLYGLQANYPQYEPLKLRGILGLYASVSQVRQIKKGESVSYDALFVASKDMKIATVSFGYADGFPRNAHGKWEVIVNGKLAKIVGLLCMDQCIIDITNVDNVVINDIVNVYETDINSEVSVHKLAPLAETNKNQIVSSLHKRVAKMYIENGEKHVESLLLEGGNYGH